MQYSIAFRMMLVFERQNPVLLAAAFLAALVLVVKFALATVRWKDAPPGMNSINLVHYGKSELEIYENTRSTCIAFHW